MKEKIDYKILKNFALGKYSLRDYKLVSRWFEDPDSEAELKRAIEQHWNEFPKADLEKEKDLSSVLNVLKEKIAFEKPAVNFRIKLQRFYSRAAAILLLPLLLYSVYATYNSYFNLNDLSSIEIYSPHGARTHFELPDGTQGWLNSGSSIQYTSHFEKNRHVNLSGEAWFEVTPDKKHPFVVSTPALNVQVLGTKFNVASFADETVTEVVLQEGKVQVEGNEKTFAAELKPNERFIYNNLQKTSTIQKVNAGQFSAWKDGLLVFRNEPLSEVLKRIGRWYNVEIVMNDPVLQKFRYRATFQDEQIEEVIRLISLTAPIEYSFDNRKMNGDGSFKKRSIIIHRKGN
ncbi:MAG: FecR family protein [Methylococcaceae bacterium]